jgi:predicted lipoprotein with Yx(FWY)xxD motif
MRKRTPRPSRLPWKLLPALGVVVAAAALLAACGGGGGGGGAATAATNASGKTVSVQQVGDAGRVLVDSDGQALYASDQEANGKVMCTGACNSFWEPLTVKGGAPQDSSVPGMLATVKRPDGGTQLTYNGMPLYSFTQEGPGEVTGDGFKDAFDGQQFTWNVISVGGSGGSSSSSGGSGSSSGASGYSY